MKFSFAVYVGILPNILPNFGLPIKRPTGQGGQGEKEANIELSTLPY
jgi:hypothetical protein